MEKSQGNEVEVDKKKKLLSGLASWLHKETPRETMDVCGMAEELGILSSSSFQFILTHGRPKSLCTLKENHEYVWFSLIDHICNCNSVLKLSSYFIGLGPV